MSNFVIEILLRIGRPIYRRKCSYQLLVIRMILAEDIGLLPLLIAHVLPSFYLAIEHAVRLHALAEFYESWNIVKVALADREVISYLESQHWTQFIEQMESFHQLVPIPAASHMLEQLSIAGIDADVDVVSGFEYFCYPVPVLADQRTVGLQPKSHT